MIHAVQCRGRPFHVVRPPVALHVVEAEVRIGRDIGCRRRLPHFELHVGLAGTQPDVAESDVGIDQGAARRLDPELGAGSHRVGRYGHGPGALVIGNGLIDSTIDRHFHAIAGIGPAPDREGFFPREDHVVGEHLRNLKTAVIPCDSTIYGLCQDAGTFDIRMDGVREHPGVTVQRLIKVDQFRSGRMGHGLDGFLDLSMPDLGARDEPGMGAADGRHPGDDEAGLGIDTPQTVDQGEVIPHELILEMRPVARVRIIDTQMDHHDIPGEIHRLPELLLLEIRPVPMP